MVQLNGYFGAMPMNGPNQAAQTRNKTIIVYAQLIWEGLSAKVNIGGFYDEQRCPTRSPCLVVVLGALRNVALLTAIPCHHGRHYYPVLELHLPYPTGLTKQLFHLFVTQITRLSIQLGFPISTF
jgi:hypothetical protein